MLRVYASVLPGWVVALGAVAVLAWIAGAVWLARRERWQQVSVLSFATVLVGILLVTLAPDGGGRLGFCGLGDWTPLPPQRWFSLSPDALNVWAFVALGVTVVGLRRRGAGVAVAVCLMAPPVFELAQYLLPLGRSCQSTDLVNNWAGAAVGLLVAGLIRAAARRRAGVGASGADTLVNR